MADGKIGWLLLAIAVAYGIALAAPLLGLFSRNKLAFTPRWVAVFGVLACPLLIPSNQRVSRALAAFVAGELMFKMVDFHRRWGHASIGTELGKYYRFLIPFPVLSINYSDHQRRLARPENPWPHVVRILCGSIGIATGFLLLDVLSKYEAIRTSFPLDHITKVFVFVLTIESISAVLYGLERLANFDTTPIIRHAFLSRTVSEFWRRYNNRVHDWCFRHLYRAADGRNAPIRAVIVVFLVSGLFHELMFGIATSRFTGYQLGFFLLQIPAVLVSRPFERLARRSGLAGKIVAHGFTILYMSVTSVLFFDGVDQLFPFIYASKSILR